MKLVINGADVEFDGRYAKTPLPWVLRDVVGLHGTKFGCGAGFCAARTVLIDGRKHEVLLDRDRAGGGQGNHHSRGAYSPVADAARIRRRSARDRSRAIYVEREGRSAQALDRQRRRSKRSSDYTGHVAAGRLRRGRQTRPGLTRVHRSSRTSLIPSASLVI
jgi:glycine/D-amino acid oxidase-like deaminating enzyme